MANRYFTGTTCGLGSTITFISDDTTIISNPINRIYQLGDGTCITLTASGATTTIIADKGIFYGPYTSCALCVTPVNSAGVLANNCVSCDSMATVTATTLPHAVYTNGQNRAISQSNSVSVGGFNGLNN